LFAGPVFSVLAGLLILIPYDLVTGKQVMSHATVLAVVTPGGPGYNGGLREGDRIVSIDQKPITDFYQVIQQVTSHPDKPLGFVVERAGKLMPLTVTPALEEKVSPVIGPDLLQTEELKKQAKLQVAPKLDSVPVGFWTATKDALEVPVLTVAGLAEGVVHPSRLKENVGGPVSIVRATADATHEGLGRVVFMAGILSVSLGIFNLLPIFPLDGGQMLVSFAEMLRKGRRLSMKAQGIVAAMGFSAIVMLVVSVLYIDIERIHTDTAKPTKASAK
jgi:regulator of sigma E protease